MHMAAKKKGTAVTYVTVKKLRDARKRAERADKRRKPLKPVTANLREVRVTVLLSHEEGQALAARATSLGRTMSHHLRELLREDRERSEL